MKNDTRDKFTVLLFAAEIVPDDTDNLFIIINLRI